MKRRIAVMIVVVVFVIAMVMAMFFGTRRTRRNAVLPIPNGYDDFAAAAAALVAWSGDLPKLPAEGIRDIVSQNAKTLETVRAGLTRQSAVPVVADMNGFSSSHTFQIMANKRMAHLFVGEGLVHLEAGRTNEAARSFTDCIRFARAAHRRGLMIDELVAIACQSIGSRPLIQLAPHLSPDAVQGILPDLIALDQGRESAHAIVQRDQDWARDTYGVLRVTWEKISARQSTRAVESNFEKSEARSVAALRLVMTELAVRAYQAKNGKPPATLSELVPAWLPAVPLDPFSHRPLVYRVTTNSFQLYSVGPDGKDDQAAPLKRGEVETGDLLPY